MKFMKFGYCHCIVILFLFIVACPSVKDKELDTDRRENPSTDVSGVIGVQKSVSSSIGNETEKSIKASESIKNEASNIGRKVPDKVDDELGKIEIHADNIITYQRVLQAQARRLEDATATLDRALLTINEMSKQNEDILSDNKKLKKEKELANQEKQAALFSKLIYVIIASILALALCIVSALRGDAKAIYGAIGAGVVIVVALGVSFHSKELAIVGFIALIAGLALAIYIGYKGHVEKKATRELVHTVEMTKAKLTNEDKLDIFGEGSVVGKAHAIQSESTNAVVNNIRKKEKEKWEHTINYDKK
jgi:ABC-type multidrug transport system fused ATPase/permease subunit